MLSRRHIHDTLHLWLRLVARRIPRPLQGRGVVLFLVAATLAVAATALLLETTELPREAAFMAGLFVLAAFLWSTEAMPLFATALLIIGLEIIFLANPGEWGWIGFEMGASPDYRDFLAPFSDPVIFLFLGGFLLARAAVNEGVDRALAGVLLRAFGGGPRVVMFGLMLVTALFSMFMSNTATTAMMITLVVPMLAQLPHKDPLRKGLLLAVPFAANIGGMGTPIASPPNAVAVGFLQAQGFDITFLKWMLIGVPLMLGLLVFVWLVLSLLFRPENPSIRIEAGEAERLEPAGVLVLVVMVGTIALWLTDVLHGLPTAVVALVPAVVFTTTGVLGRRDYNSLEWHILTLIAGGIALGVGLQVTGLDAALVAALPTEGVIAISALVTATLLLSTFMSNTAAANLLLPIGISLAASGAVSPYVLGIGIALAASSAMALPVSTPPNAIAYAQGHIETRDMALAGTIIGIVALALILLFGPFVIRFWMS